MLFQPFAWRTVFGISCFRSRDIAFCDLFFLNFHSIISTVAWLQAIYGQSQDPLIIRNDSMKPDLHKLVLSIFRLALRNTTDFKVDWVPRSLNEHAVVISRFIDCDD